MKPAGFSFKCGTRRPPIAAPSVSDSRAVQSPAKSLSVEGKLNYDPISLRQASISLPFPEQRRAGSRYKSRRLPAGIQSLLEPLTRNVGEGVVCCFSFM